jgi:hypothetical protein
MTKNIFIFIFMLAVFSCSFLSTDILPEHEKYALDVVRCESKSPTIRIINKNEVAEFFSGEGGSVVIKYIYLEDSYEYFGEVNINRGLDDGKIFYLAEITRFTMPMTECNDLKRNKYF